MKWLSPRVFGYTRAGPLTIRTGLRWSKKRRKSEAIRPIKNRSYFNIMPKFKLIWSNLQSSFYYVKKSTREGSQSLLHPGLRHQMHQLRGKNQKRPRLGAQRPWRQNICQYHPGKSVPNHLQGHSTATGSLDSGKYRFPPSRITCHHFGKRLKPTLHSLSGRQQWFYQKRRIKSKFNSGHREMQLSDPGPKEKNKRNIQLRNHKREGTVADSVRWR